MVPTLKGRILRDSLGLDELARRMQDIKVVGLDVETTGLDVTTLQLVGAGIAVSEDEAYYIPCGHVNETEQLTPGEVADFLSKVLTGGTEVVGFNLKFELQVLKKYGVEVPGPLFDAMIAAVALDENKYQWITLKELSVAALGHKMTELHEVAAMEDRGRKKPVPRAELSESDKLGPYCMDDARVPLVLRQEFLPRMEREKVLDAFVRMDMPFLKVLADMEFHGIPVDWEYMKVVGEELRQEQIELEQEIYRMAGRPFGIGSTKQLGELLFKEMGMPVQRRTGKGAPSTDADTLGILARTQPICAKILRYRAITKLLSTYVDGMANLKKSDGKLHAQFNQTGTVTGRLSSSQPNMQNLPRGAQIRNAISAPEGYKLVVADYSQIELRVLAHMSKDPVMLIAYAEGEDIHARTAAEVFGYDYEEIIKANSLEPGDRTPVQEKYSAARFAAKTINFGIVYGMGPQSLAASTGYTVEEAERFLTLYMSRYGGVKDFIERTHSIVDKCGYVRTLTGRKRRLPAAHSKDWKIKGGALRQAVNSRIQGSAADLIKIAMMKMHEPLKGLGAQILIQVHDELVILVSESNAEKAAVIVKDCMEGATELRVPLVTEPHIVARWGEAK